ALHPVAGTQVESRFVLALQPFIAICPLLCQPKDLATRAQTYRDIGGDRIGERAVPEIIAVVTAGLRDIVVDLEKKPSGTGLQRRLEDLAVVPGKDRR